MDNCLLITGRPGVGKTTLIRDLAKSVGFERCAGFYTSEIRSKQSRVGFEWRTFEGDSGALANLKPGVLRVGKYHVELESFDKMLDHLWHVPAKKIILIDEIGKMECLSAKFRKLLIHLENANTFRIFTVAQRGTSFNEDFKIRHANQIIHLTLTNREQIKEQVLDACFRYKTS